MFKVYQLLHVGYHSQENWPDAKFSVELIIWVNSAGQSVPENLHTTLTLLVTESVGIGPVN